MVRVAESLTRSGRLLWYLAVVLVAVLVVEWGARTGWLDSLDRLYSDAWHRMAGVRETPGHVVILAVDQATLDAHPDEPLAFWGPHFARVTDRLHQLGATAVGLDFLLAVSPDNWLARLDQAGASLARVYDADLRSLIAQGKVFLVASQMGNPMAGRIRYVLPHQDYLMAIPDLDLSAYVGIADVATDQDGVVRHFADRFPAWPDPDLTGLRTPELSLPALLAQRHWHHTGADKPPEWATTPRPLTYFGPPGSMPKVSMSRLEKADFASDPELRAIKGKVVLIGAYFPGMGDMHFTPYATGPGQNRGSLMAGVELHGNAVEALLSGKPTQPVSWQVRVILATLLATLVLWIVLGSRPITGGLATFGLLLAGPVLGYMLFFQHYLLSAGAWQGTVLLAWLCALGLKFTGESRRRMHMARVFSRYVSEAAVQVLMRSEKMPELGGELQQVTVLFSDIRNFTTISEILKPEEVVEMLNTFFERQCEVVLAEGGSIDKFIGDAIMAEFGAPLPTRDHPQQAVAAALRMVEVATEFQDWMVARFPDRGLPPFAIGVGLHTGPAIIGSIGSRKRSEYTAIGDTVNVASRLEGVTKELQVKVVASEAVVQACGDRVRVGKSGIVTVKGHREPVAVYEVLAIDTKDIQ